MCPTPVTYPVAPLNTYTFLKDLSKGGDPHRHTPGRMYVTAAAAAGARRHWIGRDGGIVTVSCVGWRRYLDVFYIHSTRRASKIE